MKLKLAVKDVPNQKVHQNERDLNQKIEGNVERDQGITIYKKPGLPRFFQKNPDYQIHRKTNCLNNFRSRSKDRRSHRRGSRSKSRERRRRSRSKEKSSSKKSSRHRSKSRDRERSERKRSRSKERSRDSRGNYAKEGRSLRERTPEHKGDARVTRDYDQEEAGFESNGDVKVQLL